MTTDVLIAGAGPTGLTLACDLARRGVRCQIIDRSPGPQEGSRGFGVKPRTLAVFDALGVAGAVLAAGRTGSHLRMYLDGSLIRDARTEPATPTAATPYPDDVALPEWRTEAILRARLGELGEKVRFGACLTGLVQDADGVAATITAGGAEETVRAAYVVGCDGGGSTVRRLLGIGFPGRTEEDTRALLADVEVRGLEPADAVHLWMGRIPEPSVGSRRTTVPGMLAIRPTPGAATCQVVASLPPGAAETPSIGELRRLVARHTGRDDIRLGEPEWLSEWRYNLRLADRYRSGRVFLAGDAAHVHSPFGAYGMNTGIQDAYNLAWKLAAALRGRPGLLDTYEPERRPAGRAALAASDRRFGSAVTLPRVVRPFLRYVAGPALSWLRAGGAADHPDYRDSPLSMQAVRRARSRAGDPAPDGVLTGPDGDQIRLYDLYREPTPTVLAFAAAPYLGGRYPEVTVHTITERQAGLCRQAAPSAPVGSGGPSVPCGPDLVDPDGVVRRAFGVRPGTVVVVRPDGYVGLVASASGSDLCAYLDRILAS